MPHKQLFGGRLVATSNLSPLYVREVEITKIESLKKEPFLMANVLLLNIGQLTMLYT